MTESNVEEAKGYTKEALMRMSKQEIIAVADEIGVDLSVLPKLTEDSISDAILVFLEPYLEKDGSLDELPVEYIEEELAEPTEPVELEGLVEPEEPTETPEPCETEEVAESEEPAEAEEQIESEEPVEPEEPSGPDPTVMSGSHQEILRPVKIEQSVRVRRIAESNK